MNTTISLSKKWDVRYSEYVDDLILFDQNFSKIPQCNLKTDIINNVYITRLKNSDEIMLVKIPSADKALGHLNDFSKSEIIKKVKEYIK